MPESRESVSVVQTPINTDLIDEMLALHKQERLPHAILLIAPFGFAQRVVLWRFKPPDDQTIPYSNAEVHFFICNFFDFVKFQSNIQQKVCFVWFFYW